MLLDTLRPETSLQSACILLCTMVGFVTMIIAQQDGDIQVPVPLERARALNLSQVPSLPIRPVGSGICQDAKCDGSDDEKCFESCGNPPQPDNHYGCHGHNQWALTFDDGPSEYTDHLLDILDEYQVKATFCVMGAHVARYPATVKRAYEAGHQIVSHTYSHPHLMSLTNAQIVRELQATEDAIIKAAGIRPRYVRPPFGEADARVKAIFSAMEYKTLLWNVDPTDYDVYQKENASQIIQDAFMRAAQGVDTGLNAHNDPGFISLQHDLYNESIAQVPHIIQHLKNAGFAFLTSTACLQDPGDPHDHISVEDSKDKIGLQAAATRDPNELPKVSQAPSMDPNNGGVNDHQQHNSIANQVSFLHPSLHAQFYALEPFFVLLVSLLW
ncbi:hypothetical protein BCR43DRAFT_521616 [Syncephalastrum racemosum]|uniref:NodB homology domain-containing protein n=1 Tax=Syncephalastrum racemosum TaxID=13706 RepID=A0A1X2HP08_SYNRA|nr:hypothetical protein BCR43DRAFT_521616 [Syncephalastrum racemosum]